jgi:hypothetical protein
MAAHPDSLKRESNVRIKKMPTRLHRRVSRYKSKHHHRDLWDAILDLLDHALTIKQEEEELLAIIRHKRLQAATGEES